MSKGREHDALMAARIAIRLCAMLWHDRMVLRAEVAGSIRRSRPTVHDIDLVVVPGIDTIEQVIEGNLFGEKTKVEVVRMLEPLDRLCDGATLFDVLPRVNAELPAYKAEEALVGLYLERNGAARPKSWENGILKFVCRKPNAVWDGIPLDVYVTSMERFALTLLIRTGSAEHNIRLAQRAKQLGMTLHADGLGVEDADGRITPVHDDKDLFELLKIPYLRPPDREKRSNL